MGLVERSFYGGILIVVILAARALLRDKLPRRTFPILWGAALVRLLLPFSLSSVFSIYSLLQKSASVLTPSPSVPGMPQNTAPAQLLPLWTGIQDFAPENGIPVADSGKSMLILSAVWCVGAVLCALFFVTAYVRCMRRFRKAVPVDSAWMRSWLSSRRRGRSISVRKARGIAAPLTYGVFRPVILLPEKLVWEERRELEYVLQHEYVHICHYDAVMKLMMLAALCMYWFHPLVWVMAALLNRDIELACDEGVLRQFGEQARAGYAMALIGMEEKKGVLMPLYNGFSKNAIEERIKSIMKYKKITYAAVGGAAVLVLGIVLLFATSPRNAEAAEADGTLPENERIMPEEELMDPPKEYMENADRAPLETDLPKENVQGLPEEGYVPGDTETRSEGTGSLEGDGKLAEQTAMAFWEVYLAGDIEALRQYLTADYAGEPEVFPDGQDGHVAQEAEVLAVKGTDIGEKAVGDSIDIWVEFRPSATADSLEYLWISLVKDTEGWKVDTYGLEM